jgi:tetratricopeptide (TPR) repeat protein
MARSRKIETAVAVAATGFRIVASRQKPNRLGVAAIAITLLLTVAPSQAAPGFIASSEVRKGNVYAEISVQLRCNVQYIGHDPSGKSDIVRVSLETTTVCAGAPPTVTLSREQHRPVSAEVALLDSIEYDGQSPGNEYLRLNFLEAVRFDVVQDSRSNWITVRVFADAPETTSAVTPAKSAASGGRIVRQPAAPAPKYVINLESSQRPPGAADMPVAAIQGDKTVFVSEALIDGTRWYRVRVGYFHSAEEAASELRGLRQQYPGAWIARAETDGQRPTAVAKADPVPVVEAPPAVTPLAAASNDDKIAALMADARHAMTAGEVSKAVQIYTKVLRQPVNKYQPEAQEFLALARERNGQIAHAKAEYQRYLEVYPDGEGAQRVQQRLAALLVTDGSVATGATTPAGAEARRQAATSRPWSVRTFLSQYYRRDANQLNDEEEIVNQSSIYSDISIDARRRGVRFDLSTRVTAGFRNDLLDDPDRRGSGNDVRISYAYVDLADARARLRGRLGRQTRNTGGVLGRFDGLNLTYAMNERLSVRRSRHSARTSIWASSYWSRNWTD